MPQKEIRYIQPFAATSADVVSIKFAFNDGTIVTNAIVNGVGEWVTHVEPFGILHFCWEYNNPTNKNSIMIQCNTGVDNTLFPVEGFNFKVIYTVSNGSSLTQPINLKINDSVPKPTNFVVPESEFYFNADIYANVFIEVAPETTENDIYNIQTILNNAWSNIASGRLWITVRCYYGNMVETYDNNSYNDLGTCNDTLQNIANNLDSFKNILYNEKQTLIIDSDETELNPASTALLNFIWDSYNDPNPSGWSNAVYIFSRTHNYASPFYTDGMGLDYGKPMMRRMIECICPVFIVSLGGSPIEQCAVNYGTNGEFSARAEYAFHMLDVDNGENIFFNMPSIGELGPMSLQATIPYPAVVRHMEHGIDYYDNGVFACDNIGTGIMYNYSPSCNAIGFNAQEATASKSDFDNISCNFSDIDGSSVDFTMTFGGVVAPADEIIPNAYLRPHLEPYSMSSSGVSLYGHEVLVPSSELSTWCMKWFSNPSYEYYFDAEVDVWPGDMVDKDDNMIGDLVVQVVDGAFRFVFPTYPRHTSWNITQPMDSTPAYFDIALKVTCNSGVDWADKTYLYTTIKLGVYPYMGLKVINKQPIPLERFFNGTALVDTWSSCNNTFIDTTLMNRTWLINDNLMYMKLGSKTNPPLNGGTPTMSVVHLGTFSYQPLIDVYSYAEFTLNDAWTYPSITTHLSLGPFPV